MNDILQNQQTKTLFSSEPHTKQEEHAIRNSNIINLCNLLLNFYAKTANR